MENLTIIVSIIGGIIVPISLWLNSQYNKMSDLISNKNHKLELQIKDLERKISELEGKIELYKAVTFNIKENTDTFINLLSKNLDNNEKSS